MSPRGRPGRRAAALLAGLVFAACATNPATGRRQISLVSEAQEAQMGREADQQVSASIGLYPEAELRAYLQAGKPRKPGAAAAVAESAAMRGHFDPLRKREILVRSLPRYQKLDNSHSASFAVSDAVYAILCGLADAARDVIDASARFLASDSQLSPKRQREETREPRWYWMYAAEGFRLCDLGLARWMSTGQADAATLHDAATCFERMIEARKAHSSRADSSDLDLYMRAAVQGGDDTHTLSFYKTEDRDADKPLDIRRAQSERRICQAICRHRAHGDFTDEELGKAVDRLREGKWTGGWRTAAAAWPPIGSRSVSPISRRVDRRSRSSCGPMATFPAGDPPPGDALRRHPERR